MKGDSHFITLSELDWLNNFQNRRCLFFFMKYLMTVLLSNLGAVNTSQTADLLWHKDMLSKRCIHFSITASIMN